VSGVSYLVPRARRFIDATGTYTDMVLNLEEGDVTLPSRRKIPVPPEPGQAEETEPPEQEDAGEGPEEGPAEQEPEPVAETAPGKETTAEKETKEEEEAPAEATAPAGEEEPARVAKPPAEGPEGEEEREEERAEAEGAASPPEFDFVQEEREAPPEAPPTLARPGEEGGEKAAVPEIPAEPEAARVEAPVSPTPAPPAGGWLQSSASRMGLAALALLVLAVALFIGAPNLFSGPSPNFVEYSTYLTNASEGTYLTLEIQNDRSMSNDLELVLPLNIDRSISARGGVVTISHANGTIIRMNSNNDASIRVYLNQSLETVPVLLNIDVPEGYDSGVEVHGASYDLKRKEERLILKLNVTPERVNFEQSYRAL
ncbi:MAG: hypothetical protein GKC10_04440, partial [Methanosarcinales archaeon]|nr:hypothetical protein [Methanosarcinales archaeon]